MRRRWRVVGGGSESMRAPGNGRGISGTRVWPLGRPLFRKVIGREPGGACLGWAQNTSPARLTVETVVFRGLGRGDRETKWLDRYLGGWASEYIEGASGAHGIIEGYELFRTPTSLPSNFLELSGAPCTLA